jgi:hypothetical protein
MPLQALAPPLPLQVPRCVYEHEKEEEQAGWWGEHAPCCDVILSRVCVCVCVCVYACM